jgi:LPXTG-site transpeptidase (sortase) family protein
MKLFLKITTLLLIPAFLLLVAFFILYPNKSSIFIYKNSFDTYQIFHNSSLRILTRTSPKVFDETSNESDTDFAVENITPEALAAFRNSGETFRQVEQNNTRLKVNSANIEGKVFDGEDANTMWEGLWHFPLSVSPGDQGNFVVIAHRFAKVPPEKDTFFNLDKVSIGDKIEVTQDGGIEYTYTVIETRVIEKTDRSVLQPDGDHKITLITCDPLWTSDKRLVVTGLLDKVYRKI